MGIYTNQKELQDFKEKISSIENKDELNIFYMQEFLKISREYNDTLKIQASQHSDLLYWAYQEKIDTYKDELEFLSEKISDLIFPFLPFAIKQQENSQRFLKIEKTINNQIKDLNFFKPTNYKQTVKILTSLLDKSEVN